MPCIDSHGQPTESTKRILAVLTSPMPLEEVARQTALPLYRVRAGVREMVKAGFVTETGGTYVITAAGRALNGATN